MRNRAHARRAPGGPEFQHDRFAFQRREGGIDGLAGNKRLQMNCWGGVAGLDVAKRGKGEQENKSCGLHEEPPLSVHWRTGRGDGYRLRGSSSSRDRSEEHTSELQSL